MGPVTHQSQPLWQPHTPQAARQDTHAQIQQAQEYLTTSMARPTIPPQPETYDRGAVVVPYATTSITSPGLQLDPARRTHSPPLQTNSMPTEQGVYNQLSYNPSPTHQAPNAIPSQTQAAYALPQLHKQPAPTDRGFQSEHAGTELPPTRPVFGISLEDLFVRDNSAVPMIVSQCIQAVDLFGLDVEGIYRLSGTASHISNLRAVFDNGQFVFCEGLKFSC